MCVMVIYDCVMTPFYLAFGNKDVFTPKVKIFLDIISIVINFFFAIDIIIGFRKAYLNKYTGREVRDPKLIAKKYLRSHFIIDLLSGIPFELFTQNWFLRLLPLLKIHRLKQMKRVITYLQMDAASRKRIRILYLALRLIIINHWVACGFYSLTKTNWLILNRNNKNLK
jgi:hypothetical protein